MYITPMTLKRMWFKWQIVSLQIRECLMLSDFFQLINNEPFVWLMIVVVKDGKLIIL